MIGSDSPPRPRCRSVALLATGSALLLLAATASLEATPLKGVFDYGAASTFESAGDVPIEVVSIYGSRTSSIPLGLRDRRNPPDYKYLEYDVYGWRSLFRYDGDADGVKGLDRKWVDVDSLKRITNWTAVQGKVEEYEKGLTALREENVGVAQKLKREAEIDGGGGFGLGR